MESSKCNIVNTFKNFVGVSFQRKGLIIFIPLAEPPIYMVLPSSKDPQ